MRSRRREEVRDLLSLSIRLSLSLSPTLLVLVWHGSRYLYHARFRVTMRDVETSCWSCLVSVDGNRHYRPGVFRTAIFGACVRTSCVWWLVVVGGGDWGLGVEWWALGRGAGLGSVGLRLRLFTVGADGRELRSAVASAQIRSSWRGRRGRWIPGAAFYLVFRRLARFVWPIYRIHPTPHPTGDTIGVRARPAGKSRFSTLRRARMRLRTCEPHKH